MLGDHLAVLIQADFPLLIAVSWHQITSVWAQKAAGSSPVAPAILERIRGNLGNI
jgi:hypothetical protein